MDKLINSRYIIYNLRSKARIASILLPIAAIMFSCSTGRKVRNTTKFYSKIYSAKSLILKIDFQKGFSHDAVSLQLNGHSIFERLSIASNNIIDFTDFVVYVFSLDKNKAGISYVGRTDNRVYYAGKVRKIDMEKQATVNLTVNIDSKAFKYNIDLNKGRYIGFYKTMNGRLEIVQKDRSFFYD